MRGLIKACIIYPVWANVLMFAILAFGLFSLSEMNTSFFPEVPARSISISVRYAGTSPEEIEQAVILPIENNLRGLAGIERTTSSSRENSGSVRIEVSDAYDPQEVYDEVRVAIDRIAFPAGAERPVVQLQQFRARAVMVAVYGDGDLWSIKERGQQFRDELLLHDDVSQVSLTGVPRREISVELSPEKLRRFNLTFDDVRTALSRANVDITGGAVQTPRERLMIRAYGRRNTAREIGDIVVRADENHLLRVHDIASVVEKWEEESSRQYYNGHRALMVRVEKTIDEDIVAVAQAVRDQVGDFSQRHGEVSLSVVSDATVPLRQRIGLLVRNGVIGFFLVLLVLGLFLNGRLSFWVAVGIPISFAGMFIIANIWGITINVISIMGMIIVIGILVDDAIVVAESVYQKHEEGLPPFQAAVEGVLDVALPVTTAVLTTILAFLPFFFLQGRMGSFIYQLALVVIGAISFSLVESFFVLPAHLAHSKGLEPQVRVSALRRHFDCAYAFVKERVYGPLLMWTLQNKVLLTALCGAYILLTLGLIQGKHVEFSAFPYTPRDDATLSVTMPTGTRTAVTDSVLAVVEQRIWQKNEEIRRKRPDSSSVIESIQRSAGAHEGSLFIEFLPEPHRGIPSFEIQRRLRDAVGDIPGSRELSFQSGRWGRAVSISVRSNDHAQLQRTRDLLVERLEEYPELTDVGDTDEEGGREIRVELLPLAHAAGITLQDLATQVRHAFHGDEVQRFQRGEDEIRLFVRYGDAHRSSLADLETMELRGKDGVVYPLHTLATVRIERGVLAIQHLDGRRELRVEADMTDPEASVSTMIERLQREVIPPVAAAVGDVQISFEGRERQNRIFMDSLAGSYPFALLGIFLLLVVVFRSPLQACIIVCMIPLGMLGAVWGHYIHGYMISRFSIFGGIALAGVIVNDSIVFIDRINKNLKRGMPVFEATYEAGQSRLRPILLTTLTTVAGMAPLLLETSRQARFLVPMAVSISYGLLFSSLFILFLVPVFFLTLNKLRWRIARLSHPDATKESVEPAVREIEAEREVFFHE
ncbi:efflux RND transporter permease subunit [Chitinivibrio alkaliphilus]|uniref:Acriflavin resistance protein AcrB n=1 Tax=Chitinivibrio alkaliphilus ACht1 TaxID=1313304 RepID=U7DB54_9BACT|nr:efflux RND transporter permease subunit [Chitinivibrio alkaliphilus]ERP38773.1 acriflavin resistance protein AcrB [Chitinivibrio alkaliphilus ACht1]